MRQHQLYPAKTVTRFNWVIVHGMQEYGQRYQNFAEYLSEQGRNIISFDWPGHGVEKQPDVLGDFSAEGLAPVFTDISQFLQSFANHLPNFFGHSMGSALMLRYAEQHQNLDGLILCGQPVNPVWLLQLGYQTAKFEQRIRPTQPSVFAHLFKTHNRAFRPNKTASDWLSANPDNNSCMNSRACAMKFSMSLNVPKSMPM